MTQFRLLILAISLIVFSGAKAQVVFPSQAHFIKDTLAVKTLDLIVEEAEKASIKTSKFKENVLTSYYHNKFNGRRTASGTKFDNTKMTAAHRKFAFGTKVLVTNPKTNKSVVVTINDRGPFTKGREIDISQAAFKAIGGNLSSGTLRVNLEIIEE